MGVWTGRIIFGVIILGLITAVVFGIIWAVRSVDDIKVGDDRPAARPKSHDLKPAVQKALEDLNLSIVRREIARLLIAGVREG